MKLQELAKKLGYDFAEDTEKIWNGYKVYILEFYEPKIVGEPRFVLEKNNQIRLNTMDETWNIYNFVFPPEKYDDDDE